MPKLRQQAIDRLKQRAADHYLRMQIPGHVDCGGFLADHILGIDTERHAREFDRCMNRLRRIDPSCPKARA